VNTAESRLSFILRATAQAIALALLLAATLPAEVRFNRDIRPIMAVQSFKRAQRIDSL
jgi:hypothetical protein